MPLLGEIIDTCDIIELVFEDTADDLEFFADLPGPDRALDADDRLREALLGEIIGANAAPIEDVRSEEHTSELQSLMRISYAVFCLKKTSKNKYITQNTFAEQLHTHLPNI